MGSSEGTVRGTLLTLTTTLLCLLFTPTTTLALATTNHDDNVGYVRARSSSTSSSVCSLPQEDSTISRLVFFDQFFTAPSLITTTTTAASRRRSTGRGASAVSVDWLHSTIVNSIAEADEFRDITKGKGKVTLSMEPYLIIPPSKAAADSASISTTTTTLTPTASSSFNTLWKEAILKDLPRILKLVNEGSVQALLIGEALIWRGLLPEGWTTLEEIANFLATVVTVNLASSSSSHIPLRYSEHETVLGFGVDSEGTKVKCETPNQKLPLAIKYYTLVGPVTSADQTIASLMTAGSGAAQSSSITTRDQIYHHSLLASKQRQQPQETSIFYYHHVLAARLHKPGLEHFVVPILPEVVAPSSPRSSSTTVSQYEECLTDTSKRYTLVCYISWASAEPIVAGFVNFPVFSEDAARQIIAAKAAASHRRPFRVKRSREDDDEIDEDHYRNEDQTHQTQTGVVGQQKNKGAPLRTASSNECAVDILSLVLDKKRRFD